MEVTEPTLTLERYAAISALLEGTTPRDEVVRRAALAPTEWQDEQHRWLLLLAQEARRERRDRLDALNRQLVAFLELVAAGEQQQLWPVAAGEALQPQAPSPVVNVVEAAVAPAASAPAPVAVAPAPVAVAPAPVAVAPAPVAVAPAPVAVAPAPVASVPAPVAVAPAPVVGAAAAAVASARAGGSRHEVGQETLQEAASTATVLPFSGGHKPRRQATRALPFAAVNQGAEGQAGALPFVSRGVANARAPKVAAGLPFNKGPSSSDGLPFAPATKAPSAVTEAAPELAADGPARDALTGTVVAGEGLLIGARGEPSLTLEQFASLTAESDAAPDQRAQIRLRYGLAPAAYDQELMAWASKLLADRALSERYNAKLREFRRYLSRQRDDD